MDVVELGELGGDLGCEALREGVGDLLDYVCGDGEDCSAVSVKSFATLILILLPLVLTSYDKAG